METTIDTSNGAFAHANATVLTFERVQLDRANALDVFASQHQDCSETYNAAQDAIDEIAREFVPDLAITFEELKTLQAEHNWCWFYYPSKRERLDGYSNHIEVICTNARASAAALAAAGYKISSILDGRFWIDGRVEAFALPYEEYGEEGYRLR